MRGWWCWLIDCTAHAPHAVQSAPEIDPANLAGAVVIVLVVTAIWRAR